MTSSCGYALAGRGTFLPAHIQTIGIPQLQNRSAHAQVEQVLTERIRTEFIGRGRYTIVADAAGSDAVLSGEITGISVAPAAFTDQQLGSRYLFTMTMAVRFTDAQSNEVLWADEALTFREEYELSTGGPAGDGAVLLDQESGVVDRIASDVARTVVTAILEAF